MLSEHGYGINTDDEEKDKLKPESIIGLPQLSIVVPVYKTEAFLEQCIKSIVKQTFPNFELILVDDGSPDNCPSLCDEWAVKDSRIKVIHQTNQGPNCAIYNGLLKANANVIGFVDSDDWIAPTWFEYLYEALQKYGADCARGGIFMQLENGSFDKLHPIADKEYDQCNIEAEILQPYWEGKESLYKKWSNGRWDKLWKRDLLLKAYGKAPVRYSMGEDLILNLVYLPLCHKIVDVGNSHGYYCRYNQNSLTHSFSPQLVLDYACFTQLLIRTAQNQKRTISATHCDILWKSCAMQCLTATGNRKERSRSLKLALAHIHGSKSIRAGKSVRFAMWLAMCGFAGLAVYSVDIWEWISDKWRK